MSSLQDFLRSPEAQAMDARDWNREVLKRLGVNWVRDDSGFSRIECATPPKKPVKRAENRQLELFG